MLESPCRVIASLYFYPLVTMDITRKQFTNSASGKELGKGPMNTFSNVPEYPPANFKVKKMNCLDSPTVRAGGKVFGGCPFFLTKQRSIKPPIVGDV